jgi:hypothetical protein
VGTSEKRLKYKMKIDSDFSEYDSKIIGLYNWYFRHIFKKNNLVLINTFKNASTFYSNLCMANDWKRIYFSEIDFNKNIIIGFVSDPTLKYSKGILEDVLNADKLGLLDYVKKFINKMHKHFILIQSFHTLSAIQILGNFNNKINWIPIDKDIDSYKIFDEICIQHDIRNIIPEDIDGNVASLKKKQEQLNMSKSISIDNLFLNLCYVYELNIFLQAKKKYQNQTL